MGYPGSLHNHTDYSNLRLRDSINRVNDLIDYGVELGHEVIAITEHESVSNAIKVEKYYKKIKQSHPDFKVILGNEIYLCREDLSAENYEAGRDKFYHFILLAKDAEGHKQIRELSSRAWSHSFKQGKMTRVPTYYSDLIEIIGKNPGHVIGSSACLGGFLPSKILQYYAEQKDENFYNQIIGWIKKIENIFGKGNFYLELQPSRNKEQILVNKELIKLSKELDIKYTITTDSHYLKKEDAAIHKAYLNSQEGDREVDEFYASTYMMSTEELESYLDYLSREEIDAAYETILEIKNKCEDYSLLKELKIPSLTWKEPRVKEIKTEWLDRIPYLKKFVNSDFGGDVILAQMIVSKLEADSRLQEQRIYDEVNRNLEATWISSEVNKTHWSAYFLNLQKIIDVCWDSGTLVGPGRGSGVGFILLYLLDIIQINPLWEKTRTFQWRFLNPDRVSVLDIDTDIEGARRAQTLQGLRDFYGNDRVANVVTFGTEKSKSAIQTAARGLGIDNDEATYFASLIPADRGLTRTLKQCYYGDEENGFAPIALFKKEMDSHPELWEVAQKIEGLVCRVGEHAGGVIFVDEPFENSTALMKVPNGDTVTQFDLHDCEDVSLIKIDLLSVECLDKIHTCLDLLTDNGYIDKDLTLREKYEKVIGIYNIERDDPKMWKMVHNHEIQSLFQMEQQSGIQGIDAFKPNSVDELAILNSAIRLMAQEGETERPINKLVRFKNNPADWDKEMKKYGLGEKEKKILEPIVNLSYGLCIAQEQFMELVQLPELGGFSLTWADKLRKSIAKKNPAEFDKLANEFFEVTTQKGINQNFAHYVWDVLISMSKGYGFNQSHTLAYSLIALQEMNLCYKYPIILWNTACLITDSGAEGDGTNYDKIAAAIGKMRSEGIEIHLPDINKSQVGFVPDIETNSIFCGFKSLVNVGDDLIKTIIENRPYSSFEDFVNRVKLNKSAMVSLIKGGAFDSLIDRMQCMKNYLWSTCDKKSRLTLQNLPSLFKYDLVPTEENNMRLAKGVYNFNKYLKAECKGSTTHYKLSERAINFLQVMSYDNLIEFVGGNPSLNIKSWDKVYQKWMDIFRNWIAGDKVNILNALNYRIFSEEWEKYATGNLSSWEMETLCFYYHDHELKNVNMKKYGLSNFYELSENPKVAKTFTRGGKEINLFELYKICGTCIAKDKNRATVTLLTVDGVVTVKFRKEYFSLFDKQISQRQPDGSKKIVEKSWFNRGSMIIVQGIRSEDNFVPKKYSSTPGHMLYKIESISDNGDLVLKSERTQGDEEDE